MRFLFFLLSFFSVTGDFPLRLVSGRACWFCLTVGETRAGWESLRRRREAPGNQADIKAFMAREGVPSRKPPGGREHRAGLLGGQPAEGMGIAHSSGGSG